MPTIGPFVRWAGGKTWLIPHMPTIMGDLHIEHYHEPFLGGGAIYFSMEHAKRSYLSDANSQLINTYIPLTLSLVFISAIQILLSQNFVLSLLNTLCDNYHSSVFL